MFCPKCRKELPDDSQFCLKCGHSLRAAAASVEKPQKKRIGTAIVIGSVAILVTAVFAILQFNHHRSAPVPVALPILSAQEIFQRASGGMVLVEAFDGEGRERKQGSAFVVSVDGTAITNYHVIRGASRATGAKTPSPKGPALRLQAVHSRHDVALSLRHGTPKRVVPPDLAFLGIELCDDFCQQVVSRTPKGVDALRTRHSS